MDINYEMLFSIELLHEYFTSGFTRDLVFIPSDDCLHLFNRMDVQWRQVNNRMIAFIRVNDIHEPYTNISSKNFRTSFGDTVFRIYLRSKNSSFLNFTNLPAPVPGNILYFSNLAANPVAGKNHLSKKLKDFAAAQAYLPGNLVLKPTTSEVFESLTGYTSGGVADLADPNRWASKGINAYPGPMDQIEYTDGPYEFPLPAGTMSAVVQIFGFNYNAVTPDYNQLLVGPSTVYFDKPPDSYAVPFSNLPAGKYKIQVNADTKIIYYDPLISANGAFAVIELFHFLPDTDAYSMLSPAETVRGEVYTLQFPSRRVLWKYVRKDATAITLSDTGATAYSFVLNTDAFVSAIPIPLMETGLPTLKLAFTPGHFDLAPLPSPSPARLVGFTQGGTNYLCAEMYLNY